MAGRILLVGAEPDDLPWLRRTLAAGYFSVTESPDFRGALATAAAIQPDIIMIDLGVSAVEGLSLCRRIKATEWISGAPVVLITRDASGEETAAGFEAQADDFLRKPIEPTLLLARLRALARIRMTAEELRLRQETGLLLGLDTVNADPRPPLIALIGADQAELSHIGGILRGRLDAEIVNVPDGAGAVRIANASAPPDLVIILSRLRPGEDQFALCAALASPADGSAPPPVLVVAASEAQLYGPGLLNQGAADFLDAPVDPAELAARAKAQVRRRRDAARLERLLRDGLHAAAADPLTGLYNRRYASRHLERLRQAALNDGAALTLLAFDIDHFKAVNDRYGHQVGDKVLKLIGDRLKLAVRSVDLVARMGGEEFLIAMPGVDLEDGAVAAERIRRRLSAPIEVAQSLRITVSIGVASLRGTEESASGLLRRADAAMYQAKSAGRDRVVSVNAA